MGRNRLVQVERRPDQQSTLSEITWRKTAILNGPQATWVSVEMKGQKGGQNNPSLCSNGFNFDPPGRE